jgi:hypothetical protein
LTLYNVPHDFTDIDGALTFVNNNKQQLAQLPWHSFVFMPHVMPALHAFLVELPLSGLVDDSLGRTFNGYVSEYYHYFMASEWTWRPPTFTVIYGFVGESHILRQLLTGCRLLVQQIPEKEQAAVVKEMMDYFRLSFILKVDEGESDPGESTTRRVRSPRKRAGGSSPKRTAKPAKTSTGLQESGKPRRNPRTK